MSTWPVLRSCGWFAKVMVDGLHAVADAPMPYSVKRSSAPA